jgi:hypothetical protein
MDQITAALKIVTDRMSKRSFSQQFDDGLLNASFSDNTVNKKDHSDYTKYTKNSKQKKKQKFTNDRQN